LKQSLEVHEEIHQRAGVLVCL